MRQRCDQSYNNMIRLKKFVLTSVLAGGIFLSDAQLGFAHELLPKPIVEYLQNHPNATPEQIQEFALTQSPNIAEQFRDRSKVVDLLTKRSTNFFDNFLDFIKLGVNHILSGADHILFVLTLVLAFVSIKEIFKLTGTFTIAHSITLILAGTGILTLPSKIVEPFIALSIAYVAITSVFFKGKKFIGEARGKVLMVFFFGLFHGLGFAGLLKEIQIPSERFISSLLAFNVGIEFGQLIVLLIAVPPLLYFRDRSWFPKLMKIIAIAISGLALVWVVQRIFFV